MREMLCCGGLSEKMGGSWSDRMEEDFSFAASYPLKIQNYEINVIICVNMGFLQKLVKYIVFLINFVLYA